MIPRSRNGQYVLWTTVFGRVIRSSRSNSPVSPSSTLAAAGTGMIQAAFFDDPLIAIESVICSVPASYRTSAFSPYAHAHAGVTPAATNPTASIPATTRQSFTAGDYLAEGVSSVEEVGRVVLLLHRLQPGQARAVVRADRTTGLDIVHVPTGRVRADR